MPRIGKWRGEGGGIASESGDGGGEGEEEGEGEWAWHDEECGGFGEGGNGEGGANLEGKERVAPEMIWCDPWLIERRILVDDYCLEPAVTASMTRSRLKLPGFWRGGNSLRLWSHCPT